VAYLGFLEWMSNEDLHHGLVHAAEINHPTHGRMEVCAKLFPSAGPGHRGLMNETTGWLIANLMGVKQPSSAAIVNIPLAKLKPRKGWLRDLPPNVTHWPAFCSERLQAKSAVVQFNNTLTPIITKEICAWQQLSMTIFLDEQLANADRHCNNLLRLGPKDFAVIDHDRLVCEKPSDQDWSLQSLNPERLFENQLHSRIAGGNGVNLHDLWAIEYLPMRLHEHWGELTYWAQLLLPDATSRQGWLDFVKTRAWLIDDLMRKRLGMLHGDLAERPTPEKYAVRFQNVIDF
jgi:hypothetical protein